ncbi:acyl-CoA Delta(11) desaturase-like isoform X1 [Belonocnema kinseyi]|uniref:acyl-CoA Delta(11) desaturase-like isoform X1 n=1 Tax=Belonocnema kinseyi TaxID=2817044 RepID=UPI00143D48CA|nr:acyl-CoA Delta(11) desaturase-like isoform X1 [Belonocnema kinseyi]
MDKDYHNCDMAYLGSLFFINLPLFSEEITCPIQNIAPAENKFVAFIAQGEGWHNYHHVFPWDYKAAELGKYGFNLTTALIDMFAKIGWAYDLKEPSKQLINTMIEKNGDGSHSTAQIEPVD